MQKKEKPGKTMKLNPEICEQFTAILRTELKPAMGCTEPISIAYAAAYARELLGCEPEHCEIQCSGNIIKNVNAVTVPQTNGLRGIDVAVLAGAIGGDAKRELEVLTAMTDAARARIRELQQAKIVDVQRLQTDHPLHFILSMTAKDQSVRVEIIDAHTNLGEIWHNGKCIHQRGEQISTGSAEPDYSVLNIRDILAYAESDDLSEAFSIVENQLRCNAAISNEGLTNDWGECVGKTLLQLDPTENGRICALAAAGSDARMNGCALPVVINSGSGNQGLTVSMPVYAHATALGVSHEKLLRALCVSNLVALRQKRDIGKLSAFCGAVSAAAGAVAGIAYLDGASYEVICDTVTNTICTIGGMVCDGAKSSCAGKIAAALRCGLLSYQMAQNKRVYRTGEGIVGEDIETTISNVGRMAKQGMRSTDTEILNIIIGN